MNQCYITKTRNFLCFNNIFKCLKKLQKSFSFSGLLVSWRAMNCIPHTCLQPRTRSRRTSLGQLRFNHASPSRLEVHFHCWYGGDVWRLMASLTAWNDKDQSHMFWQLTLEVHALTRIKMRSTTSRKYYRFICMILDLDRANFISIIQQRQRVGP